MIWLKYALRYFAHTSDNFTGNGKGIETAKFGLTVRCRLVVLILKGSNVRI